MTAYAHREGGGGIESGLVRARSVELCVDLRGAVGNGKDKKGRDAYACRERTNKHTKRATERGRKEGKKRGGTREETNAGKKREEAREEANAGKKKKVHRSTSEEKVRLSASMDHDANRGRGRHADPTTDSQCPLPFADRCHRTVNQYTHQTQILPRDGDRTLSAAPNAPKREPLPLHLFLSPFLPFFLSLSLSASLWRLCLNCKMGASIGGIGALEEWTCTSNRPPSLVPFPNPSRSPPTPHPPRAPPISLLPLLPPRSLFTPFLPLFLFVSSCFSAREALASSSFVAGTWRVPRELCRICSGAP